MFSKFRQKLIVPVFALGMGVQMQNNTSSFLQSPPSAEEVQSDALQERQDVTPTESLKSLPGVVITGSEVTTYNGSLFLRGASGDQTLFVWNDFRADSFTTPSGATDPFGFSTEFSNRIRVLKGPQSLLYGTQAMGGVVLIDADPDIDSSVEVAGGSLHTSRGVGEFRFRGTRWQLAVGGSAFSTEGVSAYNAEVARGADGKLERDGRQKSSASLIATFDLPSEDQLQLMVNGLRDTLSDDVPPLDDVNARTENRATQWKARYKANWADNSDSIFLLTNQNSNRENQNPQDGFSGDYYLAQAKGQRTSFYNRNSIRWLKSLWQVGLEYNDEKGEFYANSNLDPQGASFSPHTNDESAYLVNDWNFASSDLSWGVRGNCQESKACLAVYQISYQWHWPDDQRSLYGIVSSGLKRPTMYQLYSKDGDQSLQSETSQAYEVGVIQRWGTPQKIKLSAFSNQFANLIDYDLGLSKFKNIGHAKTEGFEFLHQYDAVLWDTQLSLAQVFAKDEDGHQYLLRRPVWQGAWDFGYTIVEPLKVINEFVYIGKREDNTTQGRVDLGAVMLWNAVMTFKSPYGQYFVRVNNLGNVFYEEIKNYRTPGRFVWLGAKILF